MFFKFLIPLFPPIPLPTCENSSGSIFLPFEGTDKIREFPQYKGHIMLIRACFGCRKRLKASVIARSWGY